MGYRPNPGSACFERPFEIASGLAELDSSTYNKSRQPLGEQTGQPGFRHNRQPDAVYIPIATREIGCRHLNHDSDVFSRTGITGLNRRDRISGADWSWSQREVYG